MVDILISTRYNWRFIPVQFLININQIISQATGTTGMIDYYIDIGEIHAYDLFS